MIAHLRGRVAHRETGTVVVDVAGVGYLVHVAPGDRIPPRGDDVELHTSLQVREESMTVYGFTERGALQTFELLLTSSGVGPKLALAALGTHRPEVLRSAIAAGDLVTLTAVPGIGRKVAERLVLELKDKVTGAVLAGSGPSVSSGVEAEPDVLAEVRDALLSLGYTAGEAQGAIASLATVDGAQASTLLRAALRHLGTGGRHG